jgi:DNA-binding MarR family transcriptional regulator
VTGMRDLPQHSRTGRELAEAVEAAAGGLVLLLTRAYEGVASVSVSQLRALLVLRQHDALNVTALAAELGSLPSSVSRLCDRLAAAGLVERVVNPQHRREVSVQLTRDGERLLGDIEGQRRAELQRALTKMSPQGRRQLLAGLHELSGVLGTTGTATGRVGDHKHG